MSGNDSASGFRERLIARYWKRRLRLAADPRPVLNELRSRHALIGAIMERAEARVARRGEAEAEKGAIWSVRPACFGLSPTPSALLEPANGAAFGDGLTVYHDASGGVFSLMRRPVRGGANPHELFFESYEFEGSYFSLALGVPNDLPRPAPHGEKIVLRMDLRVSRPVDLFLRMNFSRAGVIEQIHHGGRADSGPALFVFDPAHVGGGARPDDGLWLDLIFSHPRMMEIAVRDLSLSLEAG